MAKQLPALNPHLQAFIERQAVFFVGTAAATGQVNVSPKGLDCLRVLSPNRVAWLNITGSGNETAAHLRLLPRMTLMFCAFQGAPLILRLYGQAHMIQPTDTEWPEYAALFPALPGSRQVYVLDIDLVQTSCGMGVPRLEFVEDRQELSDHLTSMGEDRIKAYQQERNAHSIDGFPTGLPGLK